MLGIPSMTAQMAASREGLSSVDLVDISRKSKSKAIPVTGCGGLWDCEMLRIPHCLDNRLIDGGKVVSPTRQPHFTPQKHYFF
jgi:hypothetical protein